jgi:hypothetical protein
MTCLTDPEESGRHPPRCYASILEPGSLCSQILGLMMGRATCLPLEYK